MPAHRYTFFAMAPPRIGKPRCVQHNNLCLRYLSS
jgi:hypothetical protein